MSFFDQLSWSLRYSKKQLFESSLIVVVITLGVGVIVTVLSLLLSVTQQYRQIEYESFFRTLDVIGKVEYSSRTGAPLVLIGEEIQESNWNADLVELEELQRNLPSGLHAFVEMTWSAKTPLLNADEEPEEDLMFRWYEANQLFITGTTAEYFLFKGLTLQSGNWFLNEDLHNNSSVMVLSSGLASELFGEKEPVGRIIPLEVFEDEEQLFYTVIGVLNPLEKQEEAFFGRIAYVPVTATPYGGFEQRFSRVSIGIDPGIDLIQAQEWAQSEASLVWGDQVVVHSHLTDFQESQKQMQRYALLIGVFASMGLVIAVINILNLMLARVLKRTKSIGISMALGSSRQLIFRQFILEALSLGILGSVFGIILSFGLSTLLQKVIGVPFMSTVSSTQIFGGIFIGFVVSLFFGVYPAYLGSRINPVDALRTD